ALVEAGGRVEVEPASRALRAARRLPRAACGLVLATVIAILGETAGCSLCGGCCLAGLGACWWGTSCLARVRGALGVPPPAAARAHPRTLAYG
ncbi:unnamed protein product, partial [Prorocentrum cordatum]